MTQVSSPYRSAERDEFRETVKQCTANEITPFGGGSEEIMRDLASRQLGL